MTKPAGKPRKPAPTDEHGVTGIDFTEVRTGEDTRQRGWFWHWNELHTEYEPLLKHSGIGLITSYIVWTDRREHSPYRGYAFPSLQSQAAFSGSDRAELITINRILVALNLLEIRKEMVLRVDEQGHNWRVPHNLYRVKDRSGNPHLTARDVLHVLDLAEERKDVYRHIRHIFTSAFVPISRTNIWHQLLPDLRPTPAWQRLALLATAEEERLSARSRAGHRSRRGADLLSLPSQSPKVSGPSSSSEPAGAADFFVPGSELGQATVTGDTTGQHSTAAVTSVQLSNEGVATRVGAGNQGFGELDPTSVAPSNQAGPTSVAPSNPMYDQSLQTTRTTTKRGKRIVDEDVTEKADAVTGAVTREDAMLSQSVSGHEELAAPWNGPARVGALLAFQEANGRTASSAEERLLAEIAGESGGWSRIAAAIYEAVDSGSTFVAPKRIREIVRRWSRDGVPARLMAGTDQLIEEHAAPAAGDVNVKTVDQLHVELDPFWIEEAGLSSNSLWNAVVEVLSQSGEIRPADIQDFLKPAVLLERSGQRTLRLGVTHDVAKQRIQRRWQGTLEAAVGELLGGAEWELTIEVIGSASRRSA